MNTASFESGAKKVQNIDREIRKKEKINRFENANEAKKVTAMLNEFEATRIAYKSAAAKITESSSKQEIKNLEKLRKEYKKLGDAYDNAVIKLKENIDRRKLTVSLMKEEAEEYKKSQGFLSKNTASLKKLGVAFGGVSAASGLAFAKFNSVMGELDSIAKRAKDVGISASQLQEFGHQARLAGIETSELDTSLKAFNRNVSLAAMGTGEARQALNSMGIELTDNNGKFKEQSELLKEVLIYFEQNRGAAENAGRAARLFGETGSNIIRIFENGENSVKKIFDAKGIDIAAKQAEIYKDNIEKLSNSLKKLEQTAAGKIARTLNYLIDPSRAREYFTSFQNGNDIPTQNFLAQEMGYKNINEYLNIAVESEEERKRLREQQNANTEYQLEFERKLSEAASERLRAEERIAYATDAEYESLQNQILENEKLSKQEKEKSKKEAERAQKEAEALKLKREEYDLELKISILENGTDAQKAQAESMKNAIERNRLMKEYGFSIEEATNRLRAQKELENKGKVKYSQSDIEKAKKILERGEGGTVGKKTLEQAQAIVGGNEIQGDRVSIFKNVSALSQRLQFADAALKESSAVKSSAAAKSQSSASNGSGGETGSDNTDNLINQILNKLNVLDDIKTNFNTLLKNYKLKTA